MIIEGSVTIENTLDVQAMANACVVTGNVIVAANALTSISLPLLASVGESVVIKGNPALTTFSLPVLASPGGNVFIDSNDALMICTGAHIVNVGDCVQ